MIQTVRLFARNVWNEAKAPLSDLISIVVFVAVFAGIPVCTLVGMWTLIGPYAAYVWLAICTAAMAYLAIVLAKGIYRLAVYLADQWDYARESTKN